MTFSDYGALPAGWVGSGVSISGGNLVITPTEGANLVTNGTFASDVANWTNDANGRWDTFEWSAGTLHLLGNGVSETGEIRNNTYSNVFTISDGVWYHFGLQTTTYSGAALRAAGVFNGVYTAGGSSVIVGGAGLSPGSANTFQAVGRGVGTDATSYFNIVIEATNAAELNVDNVYVKPLTLSTMHGLTNVHSGNVRVISKHPALTTGTQAGPSARVDNPDNPTMGLRAYFDGAKVKVDAQTAALTYVNLIDVAVPFVANMCLDMRVDGANVSLYTAPNPCDPNDPAGATWTQRGATTAHTVPENGWAGVWSTNSGNTISKAAIYAN